MDPNNTQQNTQPIQQPVGMPQQPTITQPMQQQQSNPSPTMSSPMPMYQPPKSGGKRGIILLLILLILVLGMGAYVLFANRELSKTQKTSTDNTNIVVLTPTVVPTAGPATIDEVLIENPEADLSEIDKDVQGL